MTRTFLNQTVLRLLLTCLAQGGQKFVDENPGIAVSLNHLGIRNIFGIPSQMWLGMWPDCAETNASDQAAFQALGAIDDAARDHVGDPVPLQWTLYGLATLFQLAGSILIDNRTAAGVIRDALNELHTVSWPLTKLFVDAADSPRTLAGDMELRIRRARKSPRKR